MPARRIAQDDLVGRSNNATPSGGPEQATEGRVCNFGTPVSPALRSNLHIRSHRIDAVSPIFYHACMITFALAVFFLIITPGPGVLSVAGVGSAFGFAPGARYIGGLFVGTNMVALAVVSGMAAVILANENIRAVLMVASMGYLMYLAYKIAFAGSRIGFSEAKTAPGFWSGIVLQAVNPKAYAVNTALLTGFAFWPENLFVELTLKFLIMNMIWLPIHFIWLYAGMALHRLDLEPRVQRRINFAMAASLLAVVALAFLATDSTAPLDASPAPA